MNCKGENCQFSEYIQTSLIRAPWVPVTQICPLRIQYAVIGHTHCTLPTINKISIKKWESAARVREVPGPYPGGAGGGGGVSGGSAEPPSKLMIFMTGNLSTSLSDLQQTNLSLHTEHKSIIVYDTGCGKTPWQLLHALDNDNQCYHDDYCYAFEKLRTEMYVLYNTPTFLCSFNTNLELASYSCGLQYKD